MLAVTADDYVQQYDERGHPVNPASKLFGRELRRAKNDVLSTMGIVVSGEDGNLGATREREKVNLLMTENDLRPGNDRGGRCHLAAVYG